MRQLPAFRNSANSGAPGLMPRGAAHVLSAPPSPTTTARRRATPRTAPTPCRRRAPARATLRLRTGPTPTGRATLRLSTRPAATSTRPAASGARLTRRGGGRTAAPIVTGRSGGAAGTGGRRGRDPGTSRHGWSLLPLGCPSTRLGAIGGRTGGRPGAWGGASRSGGRPPGSATS